jgi:uncharacterized SAM-binding protein YcdF (DUF218 family)
MFVAGKILWLVAQPLSLAFLFKLLAIAALAFGRRWLAFALTSIAATIMFVTLFTSTGAWALQRLEAVYQRPELPQPLACMIVLGGAFDLEVTAGRGGMEMNQSADRFIEAARIARLRPEAKILISGGDGSFSGDYKSDAELAPAFFSAMGVDPARLLSEDASRNTSENVAFTKTVLAREGLSNCLLITSAYHMPRAVSLFDVQGVAVTPWPSDYRASGRVTLGLDFTQPTLNAQLTATALREWLAILRAKMSSASPRLQSA